MISSPRRMTPSAPKYKTWRAAVVGLLLAASAALVLSVVGGTVRAGEPNACLRLAAKEWPEYLSVSDSRVIKGYYAERLQGLLLVDDPNFSGVMPRATEVTIVKGSHPSDDKTLVLLGFADPSQCYFLILNDEPFEDILVELYLGSEET